MTDPTYDSLDMLIGELKRSAIDAYMRDHGYTVSGSSYEKVAPNRSVGESVVECPQEDGSGGGKEVVYFTDGPPSKSEGYCDSFDEIRQKSISSSKNGKISPVLVRLKLRVPNASKSRKFLLARPLPKMG